MQSWSRVYCSLAKVRARGVGSCGARGAGRPADGPETQPDWWERERRAGGRPEWATCRPAPNWFCPGGSLPPPPPEAKAPLARPRRLLDSPQSQVPHSQARPMGHAGAQRAGLSALEEEEEEAELALVPDGRSGPSYLLPFP